MSLLAFLVACGAGSLFGLALKPSGLLGKLACLAALGSAFVFALLIGAHTTLTIGEVVLKGSQYAGLFLAVATGSSLLLCVLALGAGWPDELAPAALASFAGLAVAITAADSGVALAAGAAAATAGALVIVRAAPDSVGVDGGLAEIRTIGLVAASFLFAGIAVLRPPWSGGSDSPVMVLAFLGIALALAVRSGAVPFHIPASHLGQTGMPFAPALILVWIPAGLGILALSWSAVVFRNGSDWLNATVLLVQVVAIATLVLGGLAAIVHDELDEVVAYSIVADSGFVLLALAARSDAAAEPARLWLLVFVVAKTGLVGWAAAVGRAFGTNNLADLRGWLRRTPLLGVALVVILIATVGWPGGAVFEARASLVRLALPGTMQLLFFASILLTIAYAGRILIIGAFRPGADVAAARSERPRLWHSTPAVVATVVAAADTSGDTSGDTSAETVVDAADLPADPSADSPHAADPSPTPESGRRVPTHVLADLVATWRLNRTLEVSLLVIAGTVLAAVVALGGFGANGASQSGIPMDIAAHATATPTPQPTNSGPPPTEQPTLAPRPNGSGSPAPSGSVKPSATPTPVKTSGPAQGDAG
jgi:NADH:ubiquinone oxidoreductase subunit 2 (subunit N)